MLNSMDFRMPGRDGRAPHQLRNILHNRLHLRLPIKVYPAECDPMPNRRRFQSQRHFLTSMQGRTLDGSFA